MRLEVGQAAEVEVPLQLSPIEERLTVSGDAGSVDVLGSSVGSVISAREIESLPLNGRQLSRARVPDARAAPRRRTSIPPRRSRSIVSSAGQAGRGGNITIDGMDVRVYLPPDANCLLSVTNHCLRSRDYINVVVAGKQPSPQWLTMDEAIAHCTAGISIWKWASSDGDSDPDVVMACCGDVPTLETLAAVDFMREHVPTVKVRVVNVVNLMKLQPASEHPHGLPDSDFDAIFTKDKTIVFAFHGYPWLVHRLTYRRTNHDNLHVRGYKEEGTTTTPFDMVVRNDMDRFHLVEDVINRVPGLLERAGDALQLTRDYRAEHKRYIALEGEDMPMVSDWRWRGDETRGPAPARRDTAADF